MTARAAMALVRRAGMYRVPDSGSFYATKAHRFEVAVRVEDARTVYGRDQYQISPVAGAGRRWVMAEAVTLEDA